MLKSINKQVVRTRKWIFNALLSLLGKKPYDEIKIANITEEAGVARQSFYRNFENKDDIVIKYIEMLFTEFATEVNIRYKEVTPDYSELYALFFETFLKNKEELLKLKRASLSHLLHKTFLIYGNQINEEFFLDKQNQEERIFAEYFIKYQIGGFIALTIEWIENDMRQTPYELGQIVKKITEPFDREHYFLPFMIKKIKNLEM